MAQTASPLDITAATDVLKEVYTSDQIHSQLNEEQILLSEIEVTEDYKDEVGSKAIGFVKDGRNVGLSSRPMNGGVNLGAAGHQQYDRWELDYTAHYGQIKVLGTTIAKMSTARQAAVRAITSEADGAIEDMKKYQIRMLYGAGDALIARCGTSTTTNTIDLYDATTLDAQASNDVLVRGWLQVGQYIDIGTTASEDSVVGEVTITAVSPSESNPQITISGSTVTTSSSHYISIADNRDGTTSYEMNGLGNLVAATGAFAGIDPATKTTWKATEVDAAGASLSRTYMQQAYREARRYGGKTNVIVTALEHQEDYYNLLQSQVRFAGDVNLASSGVTAKDQAPVFNGVPVVADPDCPRRVMYFLDTKEMFRVSAGDFEWQNTTTGGDILAWSQNEDAFVGRLAGYMNLGTNKRRAHAKIKNLNISA